MRQPPSKRRANVQQTRSQSRKSQEGGHLIKIARDPIWQLIGIIVGTLVAAAPFFLPTPALIREFFVVLGILIAGFFVASLLYQARRRIPAICLLIGVVALCSLIMYKSFSQPLNNQSNVSSPGEILYTYHDHHGSIKRLVWSSDGKRITSMDGKVQTWDAATGNNLTERDYYDRTVGATITEVPSPDGKLVASMAVLPSVDVQNPIVIVRVFDVATGTDILSQDIKKSGWDSRVVWSPVADSTLFAFSVGIDISVWNARTSKLVSTYRGNDYTECCSSSNVIYGLAWSPDGRFIVSSGFGGDMQVWDVATGKMYASYPNHCSSTNQDLGRIINDISWREDGSAPSQIVIRCSPQDNDKDLIIRVLPVDIRYDYGPISNDSLLLSIEEGSQVTLCHENVPSFPEENNFAVSPDGRYIAYSCGGLKGSAEVFVWNIVHKNNTLLYKSQNGAVTALAWSPDDQYIVSASEGETIQVWKAV